MKRIDEAISLAYEARDEIALCLIGAPGVGKTTAVNDFVKRHNKETGEAIKVVTIILSQCLPSEVGGITIPVQDSKMMEIFDSAQIASLCSGDILFFDELLQCQQSVFSAMLTIVQERRLPSGRMLPDGLCIMAATNPNGRPDRIPLQHRDRFLFLDVPWDKAEWIDYMESKYGEEKVNSIEKLSRFVKVSGDDYNVLTPRSADKIVYWMSLMKNQDKRNKTKSLLTELYGSVVPDIVYEMFAPNTKQQVFFETLSNEGVHIRYGKAGEVIASTRPDSFVTTSDTLKFRGEEFNVDDTVVAIDAVDKYGSFEVIKLTEDDYDGNNIEVALLLDKLSEMDWFTELSHALNKYDSDTGRKIEE